MPAQQQHSNPNAPTDHYIFRNMQYDELNRLAEIDRGETIQEVYELRDGVLALVPAYEEVKGFEPAELALMLTAQQTLRTAGGMVTGCFDQDALIGIASIEKQARGSLNQYCKMDILYVSRNYRGRHIAVQLLDRMKQTARSFGAQYLYISATPTRHTVDFYISQGARLVTEPDAALVAKEPLDIHLELPL